MIDLLQAIRITHAGPDGIVLDAEDRGDVEVAREKIFLEEIIRKYEQVLDRSRRLEPLTVEDPQLQEASRCLLYGFSRAAVLLSAGAVEGHLKRCTGTAWLATYGDLLASASEPDLFAAGDGALKAMAEELFKKRSEVAHEGLEVALAEAEILLHSARRLVEHLAAFPTQAPS